jgi:hypothetical protein
VRYIFPNGIAAGTTSASTQLIGDGGGNLSLFLNSTTQYFFPFTIGEAAVGVIGQPDFVSSSAGTGAANFSQPYGMAVSPAGTLYVADWNNSRIEGFNSIPTSAGVPANFSLGQTTLGGTTQGNSANGLSLASGVAVGGGALAIADNANYRVVIFNSPPTTSGSNANVVVGATSFGTAGSGSCSSTSFQPQDITLAAGKLLIADYHNNRVLIYNSVPSSNGASANLVLGSSSCTAGTSSTLMNAPRGAWTDGTHLVVSDTGNSRVLIWNSFPTTNSQPADLVLGKSDMVTSGPTGGPSGMSEPYGVWSNGTQLAIADLGLYRVAFWNTFPTENGQPVDLVLGQPNTSSASPGTTASLFNEPAGIAVYKNNFLVSDVFNNRVLIFR